MKIKDLITLLQAYPPDQEIFGYEPFDGNGRGKIVEPDIGLSSAIVRTIPCTCGWQETVDIPRSDPQHAILVQKIKDTGTYKCYECYQSGRKQVYEDKLFVGWH